MSKALALKYRPQAWDELTEQESIKTILSNQIETNTIKNGYLFTGPAGCGKTTSARIFANMINNGKGIPIELDAASNNGVDDVRNICEQAQTKALDAEYKIFILDEVHVFSNQAWQAMLKTLEEPPLKSIFILCTTNPEKIPATILSRVQRYNFQRISTSGIERRLNTILKSEDVKEFEDKAVSLLAKLSNGGMREAITLTDKCLSYSDKLTEENVVKALGVADYDTMFGLLDAIYNQIPAMSIKVIERLFNDGIDLKQFMKTFFEFILDVNKFVITDSMDLTKIPSGYNLVVERYKTDLDFLNKLLGELVTINSEIKWEKDCKPYIEAKLILFMGA